MKRLIILFAATFALACPTMSQELEGHTYACTDVDAMRDFVTSAVLADTLVRSTFGTGYASLDYGELVLRDRAGRALPLSVFSRLKR